MDMYFGKTKTQSFGNRVKNGSKAYKEMARYSRIFLGVAHPMPIPLLLVESGLSCSSGELLIFRED